MCRARRPAGPLKHELRAEYANGGRNVCAVARAPLIMRFRVSNKVQIIEFLAREFPQNTCTVEEIGKASAVVKQRIGADELRPGGTLSGPVLMRVADLALYVALLGDIAAARDGPRRVADGCAMRGAARRGRAAPGICHVARTRTAVERQLNRTQSAVPEGPAGGAVTAGVTACAAIFSLRRAARISSV